MRKLYLLGLEFRVETMNMQCFFREISCIFRSKFLKILKNADYGTLKFSFIYFFEYLANTIIFRKTHLYTQVSYGTLRGIFLYFEYFLAIYDFQNFFRPGEKLQFSIYIWFKGDLTRLEVSIWIITAGKNQINSMIWITLKTNISGTRLLKNFTTL